MQRHDQGKSDIRGAVKSLHLFSILQVLQALLQCREKGIFTFKSKEEQEFVAMFTNRFVQMQDASPSQLVVENLSKSQQCMPFFQLLDKFCIIRAEYVESFD